MSGNCKWLHEQLQDLPLIHYPFDLEKLPMNGVYFFYEAGEIWGHSLENKSRIVRIGTSNQGNFRSRIKDHYVMDDSKMNFNSNKPAPHERSIFRKNIGRAILSKEKNPYLYVWEIDFTTRENRNKYSHLRNTTLEKEIERKITDILQKNFSFRFLRIEDQKTRMGSSGIESKLIGTIAHCKLCEPSKNWLGNHSPKDKIRNSGLWLVNLLDSTPINEDDKELISKYKKNTLEMN
jgi:hypothetical protein